MAKVWIANYAGHPTYDKAERYGELRYLTRGYVSLGNLDRLVYTVVEQVDKTEPEDFLLLSGLCIIGVVAATAWLTKHRRIRILHWDKKTTEYQVLEINRGQIERMFETFVVREAEDKWRASE